MKKIFFASVLLAFICSHVYAQSGHYFLSHYKPGNDNVSYLSFDIQQDKNGILYFANRTGVLQFDGRTWMVVPVVGGIYSMAVVKTGEVFAAGPSGFGKLAYNSANEMSYLSLSDSIPKSKNVFAAYSFNDNVYFMNDEHVFIVDTKTSAAKTLFSSSPSQGFFTGIFQIGSKLYVGTEAGLKRVDGSSLVAAALPELEGLQLIFSKPSPDGKTYVMATDDGRFFLQADDKTITEFRPKDAGYLNSNVVSNCAWVTDQQIAFGTLRGGIVFIDVQTGATLEISNYYAGLPDNEIYALHSDHHQGVWVAHDYGFTRIAPFLPFRTFNHYPGLEGNLLCVQSIGNQVYVGTTLGLFLLVKEDIFQDEVYQVTRTLKGTSTTQESKKVQPSTITTSGDPKEKKKAKVGLFGRLKKKIVESGSDQPVVESGSGGSITTTTKSKKVQVQKTRRVLVGADYVYKRVQGISGKVDQLIVVGNKLVSGGVGGVFEVNGTTATPVSREPMRTILYSKNLSQLLVSTYNDEIKSFKDSPKGWQQTEFPDSLSVYADYMFEDNLQDLWICGRDFAYRIGIEEGEMLDAEAIRLPYSSVDRTVGLAYGPEVYVTQNGEFFHYASYKNAFLKYDSMPGPKKYFASAGYFWFYDGHKWRTLDPKLQGSIKTEWLALFPDIRFMAPAVLGKSLWVITSNNELYQLSSDQVQSATPPNPLFLKEIRSQQLKFSTQRTLVVGEGESALTFEFIQPEYVSLQAVEYRYWVKGLQPNWTEWSTVNNVIPFPFLPPGKYNVWIQSKDLFGKITELKDIDLDVKPPYWKEPWFYGVEFLFFGSLVLLSRKLTESNEKYRYLSRFLSALTVIMLIQLVQTVAESGISFKSTPVVDFFVQVTIALLVLPVEQFLRKRVVKGADNA